MIVNVATAKEILEKRSGFGDQSNLKYTKIC